MFDFADHKIGSSGQVLPFAKLKVLLNKNWIHCSNIAIDMKNRLLIQTPVKNWDQAESAK
jgi:hypothetical protein